MTDRVEQDIQRSQHVSEVIRTVRRYRLDRMYRVRQRNGQWIATRPRDRETLTANTEFGLLELICQDYGS